MLTEMMGYTNKKDELIQVVECQPLEKAFFINLTNNSIECIGEQKNYFEDIVTKALSDCDDDIYIYCNYIDIFKVWCDNLLSKELSVELIKRSNLNGWKRGQVEQDF